jgi:D-alanyl-D-alanine carboxypeptidase/D-alanyl-D-alanine-endopeptidase (penicillin-binding protein 4)
VMGPDHRFATRVVTGPDKRSIVLVGGGDPLLTDRRPTPDEAAQTYPRQATLQDLARQTAAALKKRGTRSVRLTYDVSLYSGPAVNPTWEPGYVPEDVVSPIVPLWVDEGRQVAGFSDRSPDPSAEAARRFASLLGKAGITVTAPPGKGKAAAAATELARVESAPLDQIVEHVLELSDNEGAETLLRQTAIASGLPGSFTGGVSAVKTQLDELGVESGQLRMYDGSGLSREDRLELPTLLSVLQQVSLPAHAKTRAVVSSLPVAGFTGSLAYRFVDDAPSGLGFVRAKTGTLTGVHGLAGVVMTRNGTPLLLAEIADRVPLRKTLDARAQLDEIAARLATCTC